MKDTFGGTIIAYIILFFLAIYVIFISLTLKCIQAFKIKSEVVDYIEKVDGAFLASDPQIEIIVKKYKYQKEFFAIKRVDNSTSLNNCYYYVTVKIPWEMPFFDAKGNWNITGATKNVNNCNTEFVNGDNGL